MACTGKPVAPKIATHPILHGCMLYKSSYTSSNFLLTRLGPPCIVRGRSTPFYNAGMPGFSKWTARSVEIAVLTLVGVSCFSGLRLREVTGVDATRVSPMSRLLALAGPKATRKAALAEGDPRCQAGPGMFAGQVSSPAPSCGTIRAGFRPRRAGR
jgi:hypothetical protein